MTADIKNYLVDIDIFQGPMDLLLYLIGKDEIDIYDIPIARITGQYMEYVEMLRLLNLENAGDYILMAATLIRIKAQMLLPRESINNEEFDPREELTLALLEYGKFKEAGEILREKRELESRLTAVAGRTNGFKPDRPVLVENNSLYELLTVFHEIMSAYKDDGSYLVDHQDVTVEDRIEIIVEKLSKSEFVSLEELFTDIKVKIIAILTFLAILEMAKNHRIMIRQARLFSEIRVYRTDRLLQAINPLPTIGTINIRSAVDKEKVTID
ncbi:MAG: segregation/condensation protein A [candidate division Zixibacteria bacterium]